MAVNLLSYVNDPFTERATLNMSLLQKHVIIAQRLMDDLVELEVEKLDIILENVKENNEPEHIKCVEIDLWTGIRQMALDGKRTGLGYTGLGDMMAALNIRYGTDAAIGFIGDLQQLFGTSSYMSSVNLAKERGAFPLWDYDKDQKSDFIRRMFSEDNIAMPKETIEDYKIYGRRNIGNLTIAPTGTVSLMTQTTSGIEPLFYPWYFRKKKTSDKTKATITDEVGDMWEEYIVFHKPFIQWFSVHINESFDDAKAHIQTLTEPELLELFENSPYYKATAQDVDYIKKVKMQGAAQRFVDHSISVTVNMPQTATVQTVRDVYLEAWRSGCKGVTVYRESSRMGILNTTKTTDNTKDFNYVSAFKRPNEVKCDVFFKKALGEEHIFFVGIIDGKPYEVMGVPYSKDLGMPRTVKKGSLTKIGKGAYKFVSERGFVIENIISLMSETERNQTRSWSMMLRHRIDPQHIVTDIKKYASIVSFEKAGANVLSNYIEEEQFAVCPECGGKMNITEGCMKCPSCGYSKCG